MESHQGFRKLPCTFEGCGKSFNQLTKLKVHMATHSDQKKFICTQPGCNKAFYEKGNRDSHVRSHLGIKQYECYFPGCKCKYSLSISLKKHLQIHDNSKDDFFCNLCSASFRRYLTLKVHLRGHERKYTPCLLGSKRKLFSCEITARLTDVDTNFSQITSKNLDGSDLNSVNSEYETSSGISSSNSLISPPFLNSELDQESQANYFNFEYNFMKMSSLLMSLSSSS